MTKRTPKINGHGLVHCAACDRWLDPDSFGYPPSLKGRPTSYCHPCQRELDRMRWRGERRSKGNAERVRQKRGQQQRQRREHREIVQRAILTLRRRGFTKAEIARLAHTSFTSLLTWEQGDRTPTRQAVARFTILLRETAYLPLADEPVYRRRLPHPDLEKLLARVQPRMAAYPLRSRWKERDAA